MGGYRTVRRAPWRPALRRGARVAFGQGANSKEAGSRTAQRSLQVVLGEWALCSGVAELPPSCTRLRRSMGVFYTVSTLPRADLDELVTLTASCMVVLQILLDRLRHLGAHVCVEAALAPKQESDGVHPHSSPPTLSFGNRRLAGGTVSSDAVLHSGSP
jgi:hypothetical protein